MTGITLSTRIKQLILLTGVALTCLFISTFIHAATQHPANLPEGVTKILKRYNIPAESLSVYIRNLDRGEPLIAFNIDTPRNPASVIKLLTTYAGLSLLGPTYTWKTHFYLDGPLENGTLNGNLIIKGGGDPYLVRETFWHMLYTLRSRGLKNIKGDLLIDDELFEDEPGSPGDFDNRPHRVYNTFPDATLLNFHAHHFHIIPQKNRVHIYADPPSETLEIRNRLKLVNGKCGGKHYQIRMDILSQSTPTVVEFSGEYPAQCGEREILRSMLRDDDYLYGVFRALWEDMGGTISGTFRKTTVHGKAPFYIGTSKPLSEIITYINKYSNNVMARQLLLTIGREVLQTKGTKASGRKAIEDWLYTIGINAPELVVDNGSGLSRKARISARTLALLLEHASRSFYQPEFYASLPLVGVDGTVRKRLTNRLEPGSARIKTGLIKNVRSMAGYVQSKNGNQYLIVSLQNYTGVQNTIGTLIQDELLKWLYEK
ncbi:MAG TPA: D-alanyl-D-alanine carboxypeptidase/D-alanyl-D-alanine-endopeptidase [Gammaproteobacteria bacterium]|nr:D-alanyl-D-alanine carboxypeptidase/D-alanyl-D-alanine-endopeptidase [Gammaproteobacteria bacterium]